MRIKNLILPYAFAAPRRARCRKLKSLATGTAEFFGMGAFGRPPFDALFDYAA